MTQSAETCGSLKPYQKFKASILHAQILPSCKFTQNRLVPPKRYQTSSNYHKYKLHFSSPKNGNVPDFMFTVLYFRKSEECNPWCCLQASHITSHTCHLPLFCFPSLYSYILIPLSLVFIGHYKIWHQPNNPVSHFISDPNIKVTVWCRE